MLVLMETVYCHLANDVWLLKNYTFKVSPLPIGNQQVPWSKPYSVLVKVNVDASYHPEVGKGRVGVGL